MTLSAHEHNYIGSHMILKLEIKDYGLFSIVGTKRPTVQLINFAK